MPKVALTEAQRRKQKREQALKALLDELNAVRGRDRQTNQDFAGRLGISPRTWNRWNSGGIEKAELGAVLDAAISAGLTLSVGK